MAKWFQSQRIAMRSASGGAWRCAGATVLALIGFIALNMAGCGGGGGGGSSLPTGSRNTAVPVTILLRDINGSPTNGSVTLAGAGITTTTLNSTNGRATFSNIPPGTYTVRTVVGGVASSSSIVVATDANQTFVVSPAGTGQIVVTGRILV